MAQSTEALSGSHAVPDKIPITLNVNGTERRLSLAPWTTLLDALRDHLDLTGSKKGCDQGNVVPVRYWSMVGASFLASPSP
jgi:hypothetical protein